MSSVDSAEYRILTTGPNKRALFNDQSFPPHKSPQTFRIFCMGGSTTFGRPYQDTTSFAGWLRELLPRLDPSRDWQVINAGGISYASYRVASLMTELGRYDPDLFIVYSGHNEFLEERTYGELRDLPAPIRPTAALAGRTRTWSVMRCAWRGMRTRWPKYDRDRTLPPDRVSAILDRSAGLDLYERDDELREKILMHYRFSLNRIVDLARSAGADLIFVTPASNLKDFSPFKSQHTEGRTKADRQLSERLLDEARQQIDEELWTRALETLDKALSKDPRFAELHFLRGRALLKLGQLAEARASFLRAVDEDICPLRALGAMRQTVLEVARE